MFIVGNLKRVSLIPIAIYSKYKVSRNYTYIRTTIKSY